MPEIFSSVQEGNACSNKGKTYFFTSHFRKMLIIEFPALITVCLKRVNMNLIFRIVYDVCEQCSINKVLEVMKIECKVFTTLK